METADPSIAAPLQTKDGPTFIGALAKFVAAMTGLLGVVLAGAAMQDNDETADKPGIQCTANSDANTRAAFVEAVQNVNAVVAKTPGFQPVSVHVPEKTEDLAKRISDVFALYVELSAAQNISPENKDHVKTGLMRMEMAFGCRSLN